VLFSLHGDVKKTSPLVMDLIPIMIKTSNPSSTPIAQVPIVIPPIRPTMGSSPFFATVRLKRKYWKNKGCQKAEPYLPPN
jgi:hypothetical protein